MQLSSHSTLSMLALVLIPSAGSFAQGACTLSADAASSTLTWSVDVDLSSPFPPGLGFTDSGVNAIDGTQDAALALGATPASTAALSGGLLHLTSDIGGSLPLGLGSWSIADLELALSSTPFQAMPDGSFAQSGSLAITKGTIKISGIGSFQQDLAGAASAQPFTGTATVVGSDVVLSLGFDLDIDMTTSVSTGTFHSSVALVATMPSSSDCASSLFPGAAELSSAAGGDLDLFLDAGPAQAGELYFVLGSTGGAVPGIPLGSVVLPLNPGPYLSFLAANPNTPSLENTFATLDGIGRSLATLHLPPGVAGSLVGTDLHHAYLLLQVSAGLDFTFASHAVSTAITL